jgi:hypothetical protein
MEVVLSRIPLAVSAKLLNDCPADGAELDDGAELGAGGGTVESPPLAAAWVLAAVVGGLTCDAASVLAGLGGGTAGASPFAAVVAAASVLKAVAAVSVPPNTLVAAPTSARAPAAAAPPVAKAAAAVSPAAAAATPVAIRSPPVNDGEPPMMLPTSFGAVQQTAA